MSRLVAREGQSSHIQAGSFLECIIGGDFTAYETQRQRLLDLYVPDLDHPNGEKSKRTNKESHRGGTDGSRVNQSVRRRVFFP